MFTGRFADRRAAGRALAERLSTTERGHVVVLGLPRGGVIVAAEVAAALAAPLDVLVVRKLGLPWQPELAMGAIAAVGETVETVRTEEVLRRGHVRRGDFEGVRERELAELRRREQAYRGDRPAVALGGRAVVLVDDGLATGSTMRAAVVAVRRNSPAAARRRRSHRLTAGLRGARPDVDELVCLSAPGTFRAVGQGYVDFAPTGDDEVRTALAEVPGRM